MTTDNPTYIAIADLHAGHLTVSTCAMCERFRKYVYPKLIHAKGIFFAGDTFDQLCTFNHKNSQCFISFVEELFMLAKEYKFFIRVLKGTHRHDLTQAEIFSSFHANYPEVDYRYFNTLDIEVIQNGSGLPLSILYMPDNLPFKNTEEVMDRIGELMVNSLTAIDLVIGHGSFDFALPLIARKPGKIIFTPSQFDFVKGLVVMGHIHTASSSCNVRYCGSFDRLGHAEEEKKGYLLLERKKNVEWKTTFVENPEATLFKTFVPKSTLDDTDALVSELDTFVKREFGSRDGHLRVKVPDIETEAYLAERMNYPYLHISWYIRSDDTDEPEAPKLDNELLEVDFSLLTTSNEDFILNIHGHITNKFGDLAISLPTLTERLESLNED